MHAAAVHAGVHSRMHAGVHAAHPRVHARMHPRVHSHASLVHVVRAVHGAGVVHRVSSGMMGTRVRPLVQHHRGGAGLMQ